MTGTNQWPFCPVSQSDGHPYYLPEYIYIQLKKKKRKEKEKKHGPINDWRQNADENPKSLLNQHCFNHARIGRRTLGNNKQRNRLDNNYIGISMERRTSQKEGQAKPTSQQSRVTCKYSCRGSSSTLVHVRSERSIYCEKCSPFFFFFFFFLQGCWVYMCA